MRQAPGKQDAMQEVATRAAVRGGDVIRGASDPTARASLAEDKGVPGDYVTRVDRASEAAIRALLAERTPDIPVVGEEEGGSQAADRYWLVDPLDGTTNFLHDFPVVAVSVALVEAGRPVAGCVHAPFMGLTFAGAHGAGAWDVSGATPIRLRVSERSADRAIVATGFPFRRKDLLPRYLRMMATAIERFEDLRRPGAAAMDLAWVAAGVFEGFFELVLGPWDVAAGGLLIEEAGGVVTDWDGTPDYLPGTILAGSPGVHAELVRLASG
jgi:myo-inositol-1(or 4)-monophosphatase